MAYYMDNGYKSGRGYHNKFPISKSWYSTTNPNHLCCKNRCNKSYYSYKCCCRNSKSPPNCGCCKCNYCCCKEEKAESHKFIDYADASISSAKLTEETTEQKQTFVICTKANVSVQSSETYCGCYKLNTLPPVSPNCLKVEPDLEQLNNGLHINNSFPINQQVPILSTCIKRTEICNSVCPAARCFNFEKQIELNPCDKNVNINVEVKVKKKKKKEDIGYRKKCKCKKQEEELVILEPCVCIKEPNEDVIKKCKCETMKSCIIPCPNIQQDQKKCTCEKPKPITYCVSTKKEPSKTFSCDTPEPVTICCPPCQSPDKSKIFNILNNFCKSRDSKTEDTNGSNVFVCKPISPNDLTSMIKGLKNCLPNCSHKKHSISPSDCVKMFKKKLDKQKTEKSKTSKNHIDSVNSDITLDMLKKNPSSKYNGQHSQRKLSSSR